MTTLPTFKRMLVGEGDRFIHAEGNQSPNILLNKSYFKSVYEGFPGGAVVKNPPANAGDTGSSPGPGRSRMPRSN